MFVSTACVFVNSLTRLIFFMMITWFYHITLTLRAQITNTKTINIIKYLANLKLTKILLKNKICIRQMNFFFGPHVFRYHIRLKLVRNKNVFIYPFFICITLTDLANSIRFTGTDRSCVINVFVIVIYENQREMFLSMEMYNKLFCTYIYHVLRQKLF